MRPIHIPLQHIPALFDAALARHQSRNVLLAHHVLVHTIQKPLDDAKLHQPPHIHVPQHVKAGVHVHAQPLGDGTADAKGREQLDELVVGHALARRHDADVVGTLFHDPHAVTATAAAATAAAAAVCDGGADAATTRRHHGDGPATRPFAIVAGGVVVAIICAHVDDKVVDARAGRVAVAEKEHVEEEDGVVVEQVAQCELGEVERDVCLEGDAAHVADAVDVEDDLLEGEVPGGVDHVGEFHLGYGDVPAFDFGRAAVVWKELHVDCICVVYNQGEYTSGGKGWSMMAGDNSSAHTNGYHALAIVVQILLDNFQQTLNWSSSRLARHPIPT